MVQYISKSDLVVEIESKKKYDQILGDNAINGSMRQFYYGMKQSCVDILSFIDTLEVIDPYEQYIQYDSIKAGIQAHAEDYSWNIESELSYQLTQEQQKLWRKEIEQACISGGYSGLNLAKDPRYNENIEVKEVDFEKEYKDFVEEDPVYNKLVNSIVGKSIAKHFFELGVLVAYNKDWNELINNLWKDANKHICRENIDILYHSTYDNKWYILKGNILNWNIVDKWCCLSDLILNNDDTERIK